ncbi:MAG TPA: PQQ-binding-like beta-propeller repeat protein [Bryobacteraceae bacterium]|nr:PQQ-binding-like beta-propeller repeat protein [Bryobacteraceae bacterium]
MRLAILIAAVLALSIWAPAQFGRGSWTTFGGDPQRTGWNKTEPDLTLETVKHLKLEWSTHLDSAPRALSNLTAPLVRASMATPRGVKDMVVVAGAENQLFVIDGDTGKPIWEKTLQIEGTPQRQDSWLCPNGLTATPVIGPAPRPPGGAQAVGLALYVLASDGKLHAFNLVSGEDILPPTQFVPPFSKTWSLNLAEGTLYTAISQNCNGVRSRVYAMDLNSADHKVASFDAGTNGAGIWGRGGAALTSDGRVIVETGDGTFDPEKHQMADSVIALNGKTLKVMDYFSPRNRSWMTKKDLDMGSIGPTIFNFKNRELAATSGKEGVIFLLDTKSLGGADHNVPLYRSPKFTNEEVNFAGKGFWGGFSTWEDASGTRWLYAPAWGPPETGLKFTKQHGETPDGSVMAFKVEEQAGKPVLTPVWNSENMALPTPVIIANGVVFAMSDGDSGAQFGPNGNLLNVEDRKAKTGHATVYALDATTGDVLFSSGTTIKGFSHFSAPAMGGGRIYVGTEDGMLHAFGLGIPQP